MYSLFSSIPSKDFKDPNFNLSIASFINSLPDLAKALLSFLEALGSISIEKSKSSLNL